jgi:hypothetical protein
MSRQGLRLLKLPTAGKVSTARRGEMLKNGNHLITRVKSNTVAYTRHVQKGPKKKRTPQALRQEN